MSSRSCGYSFFCFTSTCFAHADLAEVVQQSGVAQLAQLLAREAHVAIRAFADAIDRLREADA